MSQNPSPLRAPRLTLRLPCFSSIILRLSFMLRPDTQLAAKNRFRPAAFRFGDIADPLFGVKLIRPISLLIKKPNSASSFYTSSANEIILKLSLDTSRIALTLAKSNGTRLTVIFYKFNLGLLPSTFIPLSPKSSKTLFLDP